jgi:Second Messenger Oligonucleotide or Dinucleotide Synthetase domain
LENITLSDAQKTDGATKRESVCRVLNNKYYNSNSGTANSIYVGSWGKGTRTRPPRDVDMLFSLPLEVYHRFEKVSGNKQSQLYRKSVPSSLRVFLRQMFGEMDR